MLSVACVILGLYFLILLFKTLAALAYIKNFPALSTAIDETDISILQPILSGSPRLRQSLESNLKQFPRCQYWWLIDKLDKEAHRITKTLKNEYSNIKIEIHEHSEPPNDWNPKLFKLEQCWKRCQTNYLVILDDDTTLTSTGLCSLIQGLDHHMLTTGLPCYERGSNFPTQLLAQFVNNNAAFTYLTTWLFFKPITINGMCYAIKKKDLIELGGFDSIMTQLTDDLAVANLVRLNNGTINQTPYVQMIETDLGDIRDYIKQMHRWYLFATLLLNQQNLYVKSIIVFLFSLPSLLLWCIVAILITSPSWLLISASALVVFAGEALRYILLRQTSPQTRYNLALSIVSELIQPLHLIHACIRRRIRWRTRTYKVYGDGRFLEV